MAHDSEKGVWTLGQIDGPPRIISRWRTDLKVPDPQRPVKVTVGVMFREARPDGMPATSGDHDFLAAVEEALAADLLAHGAVLALVVTGEGNREWVAYAASHDWLADWAPAFASRWLAEHAQHINAQSDPEWSTYLDWTARLGPG